MDANTKLKFDEAFDLLLKQAKEGGPPERLTALAEGMKAMAMLELTEINLNHDGKVWVQ